MKEILIRPNDLLEFMTEENYKKFIKSLKRRLKSEKEPIWIIGQVLEKKDYF